MTSILIIIISILLIVPLAIWSWIKMIRKTRGYQIWFKKVLIFSFAICYCLALVFLIIIVIILMR